MEGGFVGGLYTMPVCGAFCVDFCGLFILEIGVIGLDCLDCFELKEGCVCGLEG
jgi:hypothetical protein